MSDLKKVFLDRFSEDDLEEALYRKRKKEFKRKELSRYTDAVMSAVDTVIKESEEDLYRRCFREAVSNISLEMGRVDSDDGNKQDALHILRSFRKIVSMDLSYSNISKYIYKKKRKNPSCILPHIYYDEEGQVHEIENEVVLVKVKDQYVIGVPHNVRKWRFHIMRKDPLDPKYYQKKPFPGFYPELNIILQGNDYIHRTIESFLNRREGEGKATQYDIRPLFTHVKTDGANWLSKHDDRVIEATDDFRIALIFWIRQKEIEIEGCSL